MRSEGEADRVIHQFHMIAQMPFLSHTDLFQHTRRGDVLRDAPCPDAAQSSLSEDDPNHPQIATIYISSPKTPV